ncbi:Anthocyanidin 3-O-galactosyltransferase F3GT1-like protein [Drosera capensis]
MSPPPWCRHIVAIPFPFGTHATPLLAAASPSTLFTFLINTPHSNSTTLPHNIIPHEIHVRYDGDRGGGVEGMIGAAICYAGPEVQEDEQLDFIPGFSPIRARDLPDGVITGDLNSPFSQMLYNMALALPKAAAVAINSFEELEHDISSYIMSSKLPQLLHIGPLSLTSPHKTPQSDNHQCIPWLDQHEQNSVAYISFGSVCTRPPSEIIALAEALDATGVSFLWSMNDNAKAKLPQWFMEKANEKGKVLPWAPQLPVLGHRSVSVFVTHGGWNSVSEGIISGVPMICRPFFGDQMLNRRTIESVWRIGVGVEHGAFTKDSAVRAIEKVLRSNEGKTMRKNVMFLKERAKEAAKVDGSSDRNLKSLTNIIAVPDS